MSKNFTNYPWENLFLKNHKTRKPLNRLDNYTKPYWLKKKREILKILLVVSN